MSPSGLARRFAVVGALVLFAPRTALSAEAPVRVTATCERAGSTGRVRCEAEARAVGDARITWGDVEIVKVAPFLTPLKGRIGPADATVKNADAWRWGFALVAREKGAGEIEVRVRVVVCVHDICTPHATTVAAAVSVGTP